MPRKTSTQSTNTRETNRITPQEFDIECFGFKAIEQRPNATQHMAYPKYLYNKKVEITRKNIELKGLSPLLVTGLIKLIRGGIPRHNEAYHTVDPNNNKRAYFYIPYDENNEASRALFSVCRQVDEYMIRGVNENKNNDEILCKINKKGKPIKIKDLTYIPMVTTAKGPQGDDDDDDDDDDDNTNRKQFVPYERIKVRLSIEYDENIPAENRQINTQVYVKDNEHAEDTSSVTDIEKYLTWNCTAQFAIMFSKVWIQPSGNKNCGIILKCVQMCIQDQPEQKQTQNIGMQLNKRMFARSSVSTDTKTATDTKEESNNSDESDDSDSDSDSDDESDENGNSVDDDDDDDDDDDTSEPESDEEPAPVKVKSKSTKTGRSSRKTR
jgi:hypothetical protein